MITNEEFAKALQGAYELGLKQPAGSDDNLRTGRFLAVELGVGTKILNGHLRHLRNAYTAGRWQAKAETLI